MPASGAARKLQFVWIKEKVLSVACERYCRLGNAGELRADRDAGTPAKPSGYSCVQAAWFTHPHLRYF